MGDIADWDVDRLYDTPDDPYNIPFIRIVHETEKAWLLLLEEEWKEWFPKNQCSISETSKIISVPYWLVEEKDL
jgi:hypothetical protein